MGVTHLVPNLGLFRQSAQQINQQNYQGVTWIEMIQGPGGVSIPWGVLPYAFFYTAAILGLAILIFRSRNFK